MVEKPCNSPAPTATPYAMCRRAGALLRIACRRRGSAVKKSGVISHQRGVRRAALASTTDAGGMAGARGTRSWRTRGKKGGKASLEKESRCVTVVSACSCCSASWRRPRSCKGLRVRMPAQQRIEGEVLARGVERGVWCVGLLLTTKEGACGEWSCSRRAPQPRAVQRCNRVLPPSTSRCLGFICGPPAASLALSLRFATVAWRARNERARAQRV